MIHKIKIPYVIYSTVALVTVILILTLTLWASGGTAAEQLNYIDAEVILSEETSVRREYIVGQSIDGTGVSLQVGDEIYTADQLEFSVDNESAGTKMVEVYRTDGNNYYRGYYDVTYFYVRHLDLRSAPTSIQYDEDGNLVLEGMELWAELSGQPTAFLQPDDPDMDTVIILDEETYSIQLQNVDENGGYSVQISCGGLSVSFYFIEANGEMIILDSTDRIMYFTNESGTEASLTLYITSWGETDGDKLNIAEGFFIYEDEEGVQYLEFDYYLENNTWDSYFNSNTSGVNIYRSSIYTDDGLIVEYNGIIFNGTSADWRRAILNN